MTDESPLATLGRQYENYLGKERGVAVRSRNTRLAAIHSFFQYVSFQEPARADQCRRVLAIPSKRYELKPGTRTPLSLACARWVGHEDVIPRIAIWPGANPSEITTGDGPRSRRK